MSHPSPDIRNYTIGKGVCHVLTAEDSDWRDVGNVPVFEFTPNLTTLDHYSSRSGVKKKDRKVVTEKSGTLKLVMEEWTLQNLRIALLGAMGVDSTGKGTIDIFSGNAVSAQVKFTGTNEVGTQFEWLFPAVDFIPSAALSPISDEWGQMEVSGEVLADASGKFGTVTELAVEA